MSVTGFSVGVYSQTSFFNEPVQTFVVTSVANPNAGNPGEPAEVYNIDGVIPPPLTLDIGKTNRFNLSNYTIQQTPPTHFQLGDNRSINLQHGSIIATDSSDQIVSVYAGTDAINDAVAKLLPSCDRSTQERFMQILTDHIRKVDGIEA